MLLLVCLMIYQVLLLIQFFYHLLQFESDAEVINSLEIEFRRDERVMRYLTVKLDKFAIEWAKKRVKKIKSKIKS